MDKLTENILAVAIGLSVLAVVVSVHNLYEIHELEVFIYAGGKVNSWSPYSDYPDVPINDSWDFLVAAQNNSAS